MSNFENPALDLKKRNIITSSASALPILRRGFATIMLRIVGIFRMRCLPYWCGGVVVVVVAVVMNG
jgi:hypothetical protein